MNSEEDSAGQLLDFFAKLVIQADRRNLTMMMFQMALIRFDV